MQKKFLSVLLTLLMMAGVIAAAPVMASAATISVSTAAELADALDNAADGDIIKLTADITYNDGIFIEDKNITFDLNGKTLNVTEHVRVVNGSLLLANPNNGALNMSCNQFMENFINVCKGKVEVTNVSDSANGNVVMQAQESDIIVYGNVTITGASDVGAAVYDGDKITIEGTFTVAPGGTYIRLESTDKTQADFSTPTTKAGYLTYTDGTNTVWVKEPPGQPTKYVGLFGMNTSYPSNFLNWLLFIVGFGFLWMWFI